MLIPPKWGCYLSLPRAEGRFSLDLHRPRHNTPACIFFESALGYFIYKWTLSGFLPSSVALWQRFAKSLLLIYREPSKLSLSLLMLMPFLRIYGIHTPYSFASLSPRPGRLPRRCTQAGPMCLKNTRFAISTHTLYFSILMAFLRRCLLYEKGAASIQMEFSALLSLLCLQDLSNLLISPLFLYLAELKKRDTNGRQEIAQRSK